MKTYYDLSFWDKRAQQDVNFSSVVAPDDKIGLKTKYLNIIHQKYIGKEILELAANSSILDFGCGVGRLSQWDIFKNHFHVGIDRSPRMIEVAKTYFIKSKNVTFNSYDGETIPYINNSFDCIISIGVLQHVIDDNSLMNLLNEFSRVLKSNGKILLFEQTSDIEKFEYIESNIAFKKIRTIENYINLFNPNFKFEVSKKTDGLVSYGFFYRSLYIFSQLHLSFIKPFIKWFVRFDQLYYYFITKLHILKPKRLDTFILFRKKN